ncbi:hypothetical protein BGP75_04590 [Motiliproteus sp. MSK22-1]|nr:hypothetical protein BGP75_04590 [Motiliproteus sp. MSK22-1]
MDLDIGNTFVKWRYGTNKGRIPTAELDRQLFLGCCGEQPPARVRLASVAGQEQEVAISEWSLDSWGVTVEVARTVAQAAGVSNSYEDPSRMGIDRWLAMIAGYNLHQSSCCIVDCGSAITIDYVDDNGAHLGGYIMPGKRLMRQGLLSNTERILVDNPNGGWGNCAPGIGTDESVEHGVCLLLCALAERVRKDYRLVLGEQSQLIVAGGDGAEFIAAAGVGQLRQDLVIEGLSYVLP